MRFCVRCCFWWQEGDWCERDSQLGSLRMGRAGNSLLTLKRLCNITQISNALENSGKIYCSAVNTRYCPRPKITRETLIFPEGLFDPAVIMYYCSFVFQCFYIYALNYKHLENAKLRQNSFIRIEIQIITKSDRSLPVIQKFHQNSPTTFWAIVQTNQRRQKITSLAEVINLPCYLLDMWPATMIRFWWRCGFWNFYRNFRTAR